MIKQVRIQNFKSLADVEVTLGPVTILIGQSGSGKSNFVDALGWLRDYLVFRSEEPITKRHGNWNRVLCATKAEAMRLSFELTFGAPQPREDYSYLLSFQQDRLGQAPTLHEEKLCLGSRLLFHHKQGRWVYHPELPEGPGGGGVMLGALTGYQEVTIAYLLLTREIGCYSFPDNVLTHAEQVPGNPDEGLMDHGENFLRIFTSIHDNLTSWQHLRGLVSSLQALKTTLKSVDLQLPERKQIRVLHQVGERKLSLPLAQESEGFRRLLACLLALYQEPPKQTLIFDEPEKGLYPAGLAILAEEFKGYASKGRGQVLLTTHSPEFLNHFAPEQIRVVEMKDYVTRVGQLAPEQLEALREHFLETKELLTVDPGRLEGSLAEAS